MVRQGDIIKLDFSPVVGSEQGGYRPAVVVSNDFIISKTNMVYVAPITGTVRPGFPLHVALDNRTQTTGDILCEQVKAIDIGKRAYKVVERVPEDILERVLDCIIGCFNTIGG